MRIEMMSGEPISTGLLTAGLYKLLAFFIGSTLAAVVVMSLTQPRTSKEFGIALICTLMSSIGGGGSLVMYLGLQHWAQDLFGLFALLSLCFVCGLPGWVVVRWWFNWVAKNPDRNPADAVKEIRDSFR